MDDLIMILLLVETLTLLIASIILGGIFWVNRKITKVFEYKPVKDEVVVLPLKKRSPVIPNEIDAEKANKRAAFLEL